MYYLEHPRYILFPLGGLVLFAILGWLYFAKVKYADSSFRLCAIVLNFKGPGHEFDLESMGTPVLIRTEDGRIVTARFPRGQLVKVGAVVEVVEITGFRFEPTEYQFAAYRNGKTCNP